MTVYRFRHGYLLLEPTAPTLGCIRVFLHLWIDAQLEKLSDEL